MWFLFYIKICSTHLAKWAVYSFLSHQAGDLSFDYIVYQHKGPFPFSSSLKFDPSTEMINGKTQYRDSFTAADRNWLCNWWLWVGVWLSSKLFTIQTTACTTKWPATDFQSDLQQGVCISGVSIEDSGSDPVAGETLQLGLVLSAAAYMWHRDGTTDADSYFIRSTQKFLVATHAVGIISVDNDYLLPLYLLEQLGHRLSKKAYRCWL